MHIGAESDSLATELPMHFCPRASVRLGCSYFPGAPNVVLVFFRRWHVPLPAVCQLLLLLVWPSRELRRLRRPSGDPKAASTVADFSQVAGRSISFLVGTVLLLCIFSGTPSPHRAPWLHYSDGCFTVPLLN